MNIIWQHVISYINNTIIYIKIIVFPTNKIVIEYLYNINNKDSINEIELDFDLNKLDNLKNQIINFSTTSTHYENYNSLINELVITINNL